MGFEPNELPLVNSLDRSTPSLRRELVFRPQTFGGKQCYVVEDPLGARFFRVGLAEYAFMSRLDGRKTIGEVLEETLQSRCECQFTPSDALAICQWVERTGLAQDDNVTATGLAAAGQMATPPSRRGGRVSPLSIQVPLFHPDRFFQGLTPWFSWLFSFPALLGWLFVASWAVRDLVVHHDRLSSASTDILAADNWIWLGIAWVLLKIFHECGHAIACKRFGGEVREAGVIFILLAPLAYVDVTSSWRLRSKWHRIAVCSAGMYVELLMAAVAALIWVRVAPGVLSQVCMNVMVSASVMTILFNANPLMRFDGYYVLSDFLEMPNLYASGQQYVRHLVRSSLFGLRSVSPAGGEIRGAFIRLYGVLSWVWRQLVFFGLVLTAATLLDGAGVILSIVALLFWLASLARKAIGFARAESSGGTPSWARFAIVGGGAATVVLFVFTCVPWPGSVTAPAIVQFAPETVVRTQCDGFVRKVRVQGGTHVEQGQVLIEMFNDELQNELLDLDLEIQQSRQQRRIYERQNELATAQAEAERLRTLERQYEEKREELDHLIVRAPCSGEVVGRGLDALQGTYQTKGARLLSVGDESSKEIRVSIGQQDMVDFRSHTGATMRVYFPGAGVLESPLAKVEPRASLVPLDLSLCAPNGGRLAVQSVDDDERLDGNEYELLAPRFTGVVSLKPYQSKMVRAGQRARVALRASETVGEHLYHVLFDWVDTKLQRKGHRVVSQGRAAK